MSEGSVPEGVGFVPEGAGSVPEGAGSVPEGAELSRAEGDGLERAGRCGIATF